MNSKICARLLLVSALSVAMLVAFVGLSPLKAHAATASLSIPVEQIFSLGPEATSPGSFSYELRRITTGAPLPAGAIGDVYTFTLTGSQTVSIGPLVFDRTGTYTYEVRSVAASAAGYTLDDRVYTIIIAVRSVAGGGLVAQIQAIYLGTAAIGNKVEYIVFEKEFTTYPQETDPPPEVLPDPPPGDGDEPGEPGGTPGGTPGGGAPGGGAGAGTGAGQPSQGPKTGDYADPVAMLFAMGISALIALFTIGLICMDRRSEKEHGGTPLATG
ncbi:MAG: hypothetical protein FWE48_02250 [Coriobacteriia bacterium]|nr:hypothetical protein [Coriobacteriia bacterium]